MGVDTVSPMSSSETSRAVADRDVLLESLEREVGVLMRRARRVMAVRAALVHPDLMPTSYIVLAHINDRGPVRASEVADFFDLDKGAVSRVVQHLAELGLVERSPDPQDRRATLLAPTDEARVRMQRVVHQRRARLKERLDEWGDDGLTDFVGHLSRYNQALESVEPLS